MHLTNFVCMSTSSSATSTRWQTLSTVDKLCLQYDKLCLQKFVCSNLARARRVGGTWGRRNGRDADLWVCFGEIFWLHGQVCLHFDEVCLHMTNLVYIMTRFVYTYALMPNLSALWQTLSTPWQSLLQQANFVMHLTNFVCITQINSVCHADDKVCHEVTHFFISPTNIVCVLYTVYCVLCTV